jgi:hypothetical protein
MIVPFAILAGAGLFAAAFILAIGGMLAQIAFDRVRGLFA